MEPDTPVGVTESLRRLLKTLIKRAVLAWLLLQLLLHQSTLVQDSPLVTDPLQHSFSEANMNVLGSGMTLVWDDIPGSARGGAEDLSSLEERVHTWLAALGEAFDVETWQVVKRSERPLVLGLSGSSPDGLMLELWLHAADVSLPGLPSTSGPSLLVRLRSAGRTSWETVWRERWWPTWPQRWREETPPHVVVHYLLAGDGDDRPRVLQSLARTLSARVVAPDEWTSAPQQAWLASPRGAALPVTSAGARLAPGNMHVSWEPGSITQGWPEAWREGEADLIELTVSPHPMSALGHTIWRSWVPAIGTRTTSGIATVNYGHASDG